MMAVLRKEIAEIDLLDFAADALVGLNWLRYRCLHAMCKEKETPLPTRPKGLFDKLDSSTGYAQIFAFVAVNSVNYALDRGLDTPESFGLPDGRRLKRDDPADRYRTWRRLLRDRSFNLRMGMLNLISAAEEMNGHTDFDAYTPEEWQRAFTRYNANVRHITPYGKEVYGYYLKYKQ